ncbi:MAG TPA: hypothetical protein DDY91_24620 [Planctomycetaceae bacterium]|nr:hypothetical protein [Planctomycetaceae bacterium]
MMRRLQEWLDGLCQQAVAHPWDCLSQSGDTTSDARIGHIRIIGIAGSFHSILSSLRNTGMVLSESNRAARVQETRPWMGLPMSAIRRQMACQASGLDSLIATISVHSTPSC